VRKKHKLLSLIMVFIFAVSFLLPGSQVMAATSSVSTSAASVDDDWVTLKAKVSNLDSATITSYGFYWDSNRRDVVDGDASVREEVGDEGDGLEEGDTFELDIDTADLNDRANYYFKAYIEVDGEEYIGSIKTFTLGGDVPEVTTNAATAIKANAATLNGTIESFGDDNEITEYGFYYGTSSSPTTKKKVGDDSDNIDEGDDFDYDLSGLKADTKYYFKSYARNSEGIAYGSVKNFTTKEGAPVITTTSSVFTIGMNYYLLNGSYQVMDAAPYIKNSRTYLPIRYVGYAMGLTDAQIQWYEATRTVILTKGNTTVVLVIGSPTMFVNGQARMMDVAPEISNSRTCLPIAWVASAFGYNAAWNGATQQVTISGVTVPGTSKGELKLSRSSLTLEPGDDATITGTLNADIDDVEYDIAGDRVVTVKTTITGTSFKATVKAASGAGDGDEATITFTVTDKNGNKYEAELDVAVEDNSSSNVDVNTLSAYDIGTDYATLKGEVADADGLDIPEFGFYYGTKKSDVADGEDGDADYETADGDQDEFYLDLTDLDESETYYFMAYAVDEDDNISYGTVRSFKTK